MKPIVLIHGYSSESKGSTAKDIKEIYHSLPNDLRKKFGSDQIEEIDLSRWLSLEDGVTIDDISFALNRALISDKFRHLLDNGFHVIIHSTGALIIRNWIRKYTTPGACQVERVIYLAGANFGSGWAHIGSAQLSRWGREILKDEEAGVKILSALEFGSGWTLDLHRHFMTDKQAMRIDYKVEEFCIIGSQAQERWFPIPVRYAKEDGADGVVRVSGCNLNINYLQLKATDAGKSISWNDLEKAIDKDKPLSYYQFAETWQATESLDSQIPFAIPYDCAHSGADTGIVSGKDNRDQLLTLISSALSKTSWQNKIKFFDNETADTYKKAASRSVRPFWKKLITQPSAQYDPHAQIIFRVVDQFGDPVNSYDIYFDSVENQRDKSTPLNLLMEHKHVNSKDPNIICFYLRTEKYNKARAKDSDPYPWDNRITEVNGCHLEISATEKETDDIKYLPLRIEFSSDQLKQWIRSHETTIIDVELQRFPSGNVYKMVKNKG